MKKAIVLFCVIVLFLTGCQKIEVSKKEDSEKIISEESISIFEETADIINIYFPSNSDHTMNTIEEQEWESYVNNKYSINIDLIYYDPNDIGKEELFDKSAYEGIVYTSSHFSEKLISKGNFQSISDYDSNIYSINTIYDQAATIMNQKHDTTYFIPAYIQQTFRSKYFYEDFLNLVDMGLPETIDDYKLLGEKLKEEDIYLMIYHDDMEVFFDTFRQIFTAFGCYFDTDEPYNIIYNPITEEYELLVLNDNFEQAFLFIQQLIDNGYVYSWQDAVDIFEKKAISYEFTPYGFDPEALGPKACNYYLEGDNKEKLIYTNNYTAGFMVLKNTKNVSSYMSFLFDRLYKEYDMMFDFYNGIEGKNYDIENGIYYVHNIKDNWAVINYPGIRLSLLDGIFNVKYTYHDYSRSEEYKKSISYEKWQELISLDKETMFYYPDMYREDLINAQYKSKLKPALEDLYESVFHDDMNLNDAISKYREQVTTAGMLDVVDQLNNPEKDN